MPVCEDLATKAELQELRDQLNTVLGEREEGGNAEIFRAGGGITGGLLLSASTMLGFAKKNAPKAITQITMTKGVANGFSFGLPEGKAVLEALKANGQKVPQQALNEIGEQIGKTKAVGKVGVGVAKNGAGGTLLLANLAQLAATLALNKATVDIFDNRINAESAGVQQALNQQNTSMLRLYDKHEGRFDDMEADIENQDAVIANTQQQLSIAQDDIIRLNSQAATFDNRLTEANQSIQQLKSDNAALVSQVSDLEAELAENYQEYLTAIAQIETQLNAAIEIIDKMKIDAQKQNERITLLEATVLDQQSRLEGYEIATLNLQANVIDLRLDFDLLRAENSEDIELREINSKLASAKLIIEQFRLEEKRKRGNGNGAAIGGAAAAQTGVLELTNKLASPDLNTIPIPTTITRDDIQNNPETFRDRLEQLLDRITPDSMTPAQMQEMRDNFKIDLQDGMNLAIGSLLIPDLVDLKNRTSEESISRGVQAGICRSLNGGSCSSTSGNPNPTQGLQGMKDGLEAKLLGLDLLQGAEILSVVKNTNEAVRHAGHGLEAIQRFADTAWKATQADKILNGITTALVIHNAAMLSKNLAVTLGETATIALQAMGIKDHADQLIDVNSVIKAKMNSMMSTLLGAENYTALTQKIAAANRIYQSAANTLNLVRNLFDSARNVAELTANNTGKIGNALREAGAVYEDAYQLMEEKVNPQNQVHRRLEGLSNTLGTLAEGASAIAEVSSEVIETKDNIAELKAERKQLADETKIFLDGKKEEKDAIKLESEAKTELDKIDFTKDEEDD